MSNTQRYIRTNEALCAKYAVAAISNTCAHAIKTDLQKLQHFFAHAIVKDIVFN